jgi:predicted outer membrane repeat protein
MMSEVRGAVMAELVLAVLMAPMTGCGGEADHAAGDSGTDTGTDTDTDFDNDAGIDGGSETTCPVHVDGSLAGYAGHDGSSWALALATLQEGIDVAAGADCEVWVAAGTYAPVELGTGIALYGGFDGTEASRDERDWIANVTIVDGGGAAASVVVGADEAIIDGFTITGGTSEGMLNAGVSPIVSNCAFVANSGDGVRNSGEGIDPLGEFPAPVVTGCMFSGNTGCGIANAYSNAAISDCVFEDNGCGLSASADDWKSFETTVTRCTFSNNAGVGIGQYYNCATTVTNCVFEGNGGGAISNAIYDSAYVTNSIFIGNTAISGGAIYDSEYSSSTVTNCTFLNNSATEHGGAVYNVYWATSTVTNSVLWGNTAPLGSEIFNDPDYESASSTVTYSDVQGGCAGTGNIDADPLFVNADIGVGVIDLHLQDGSPCVDTASNDAVPTGITTDLDGNLRIVDGNDDGTATVDMGAYEVQL